MNFKLLLIFILVYSCATPKKEIVRPEKKLVLSAESKQCLKNLKYYQLLSELSPRKNRARFLKKYSPTELCTKHLSKTTTYLNTHKGKIGIVFEYKDESKEKDLAILKGLLRSIKSKKHKEMFVIRKVKLQNKSVNKALSELVFDKKVGALITWGDPRLMNRIQQWQKGLNIPTVYIGHKVTKGKNSFQVFPNRQEYGEKLVYQMKRKGIKRIAILTPERYKKVQLLKKIKKEMKKQGIEIVFDVLYQSSNYDSMNLACRKIFTIDRFARSAEYHAILRDEKQKANAKGFKLNKKLVFLPALVEYDAIFIPDNFKIVNHFAKLFEYYQAKRIPLVGTYEWRSQELFSMENRFLQGSFFVDFVGNPQDVPVLTKKERMQLNPNANLGKEIDYKLMGYYTGLLTRKAVARSKKERAKVERDLKKMRIKDRFLKNAKAFDKNKFNWPSYAFEIENDRFKIMELKDQQTKNTKKPRKK